MVCGADANALQTLPPLIFTTTPFLHSPHLSGKETETQGDRVTCQVIQLGVVKLKFPGYQ